LTAEQREQVEGWVRAKTSPQRLVFRSRIVLLAADGLATDHIATQLATSPDTVRVWRRRSAAFGPDGLTRDAAGRVRKPIHSADRVHAIVQATLQGRPDHATHWTLRGMAAHAISRSRQSMTG
jgi:transposase